MKNKHMMPFCIDGRCRRIVEDCEECEREYVANMNRDRIVEAYKRYLEREDMAEDESYYEKLRTGKYDIANLMYTESDGEEFNIEWLERGTPLQVRANIRTMTIIYEVDNVVIHTEVYSDADKFIEDNFTYADFDGWYDAILDVIYNEGDKARETVEESHNIWRYKK